MPSNGYRFRDKATMVAGGTTREMGAVVNKHHFSQSTSILETDS